MTEHDCLFRFDAFRLFCKELKFMDTKNIEILYPTHTLNVGLADVCPLKADYANEISWGIDTCMIVNRKMTL